MIAVAVSLCIFIADASRLRVSELGRVASTGAYLATDRYPDAAPLPGVTVLRPDGQLFFANVDRLLAAVDQELRRPERQGHLLVLDLAASFELRSAVLDALVDVRHRSAVRGRPLAFAHLYRDARDTVAASRLRDIATFTSLDGAVASAAADHHHVVDVAGVRPALSLICQRSCTATSLASRSRQKPAREVVVTGSRGGGGAEGATALTGSVAALDAHAAAALLVAELADGCDQWTLVEATARLLQEPVGVEVLDPLTQAGLVTLDGGSVRVTSRGVARAATYRTLPSRLHRTHAVLAATLRNDPLARGWHQTRATAAPASDAAALAVVTARGYQRAGRPARALVMLKDAARLATTAADRGTSLLEAGVTAFALGEPDVASSLVTGATTIGLPSELVRVADAVTTIFTMPAPAPIGADGHLDQAVRTLVAWHLDAVAFSVVASGDERLTGRAPAVVPPFGALALEARSRGDLARAAALFAADADGLGRAGMHGVEAHARTLSAEAQVHVGALAAASVQALRARELSTLTRQPSWQGRAEVVQAMVAAVRGGPNARGLVDAARVRLHSVGRPARLLGDLAYALTLLDEERWGEGLAVLESLLDQVGSCPELLSYGLLGHVAEAAGHTRGVERIQARVAGVGRSQPVCRCGAELADLLYATALLTPDLATQEVCFARLRTLDPTSWPWVRARVDLAHGAMLRRHRQSVQARAHLGSAHRMFRAMGLPAWERRAALELRAAGVRPDVCVGTADGALVARLSPQESAIARLAAQGLTNREIGERLFLSPRTIGSHLYRIFPKLDVTSRAQLAQVVPAP